MRTMHDCVDPTTIPATAQMVAGYLDGPRSQWPASGWDRFAGKVRVAVTVDPAHDEGHVLDVERYDATPADVPGWLTKRRAAGCDPTVYCAASAVQAVRDACAAAGVQPPHFWVADWTGVAHLPDGAVACQWGQDGGCDVSVVADYWPGVDNGQTWPSGNVNTPPPEPPAAPSPASSPAQGPTSQPPPQTPASVAPESDREALAQIAAIANARLSQN